LQSVSDFQQEKSNNFVCKGLVIANKQNQNNNFVCKALVIVNKQNQNNFVCKALEIAKCKIKTIMFAKR
jgi:hypothetical protein